MKKSTRKVVRLTQGEKMNEFLNEKVNFELVPESDWGDEYEGVSGRATTVVRMESLDGSFIEKFVDKVDSIDYFNCLVFFSTRQYLYFLC